MLLAEELNVYLAARTIAFRRNGGNGGAGGGPQPPGTLSRTR